MLHAELASETVNYCRAYRDIYLPAVQEYRTHRTWGLLREDLPDQRLLAWQWPPALPRRLSLAPAARKRYEYIGSPSAAAGFPVDLLGG